MLRYQINDFIQNHNSKKVNKASGNVIAVDFYDDLLKLEPFKLIETMSKYGEAYHEERWLSASGYRPEYQFNMKDQFVDSDMLFNGFKSIAKQYFEKTE